MKGNISILMMVIGAIAFVVTLLMFSVLPDIGIWKHIISISVGTMIIGIGGYVDIRFGSKE